MKDICEGCALGKHHRESFPKNNIGRAKAPLELAHTDENGLMKTISHAEANTLLSLWMISQE